MKLGRGFLSGGTVTSEAGARTNGTRHGRWRRRQGRARGGRGASARRRGEVRRHAAGEGAERGGVRGRGTEHGFGGELVAAQARARAS